MHPLRIAQISDLHFAAPSFNPLQFLSKRWLGNLNAFFSRNKIFCQERLLSLIPLLKEEKVSHLVVTGDLSTTSHPQEFIQVKNFLEKIEDLGISVHVLPGNHDNYTRQAYTEKTFYNFFDSSSKTTGVSVKPLGMRFWLITLDTTLATSLISSHGYFSPAVEKHLDEILAEIPPCDKVILANHFPLFDQESPRKSLKRSDFLRSLVLKYPQITFYLHGHTHTHCIADLRESGFPIILDCGCTPHRTTGAFHIIEIEKERYNVKVFRWQECWQSSQEVLFHV
jgi:3',5'-cyclic AMP phosphodiesterase CpdA